MMGAMLVLRGAKLDVDAPGKVVSVALSAAIDVFYRPNDRRAPGSDTGMPYLFSALGGAEKGGSRDKCGTVEGTDLPRIFPGFDTRLRVSFCR